MFDVFRLTKNGFSFEIIYFIGESVFLVVLSPFDEDRISSVFVVCHVEDAVSVVFQAPRNVLHGVAAVEPDKQDLSRFHIFQFDLYLDVGHGADDIGNIDGVVYVYNTSRTSCSTLSQPIRSTVLAKRSPGLAWLSKKSRTTSMTRYNSSSE